MSEWFILKLHTLRLQISSPPLHSQNKVISIAIGNRLLLHVIHNYLCTNACLLIKKCMKILGDNSCMLELEPSNLIRTPFNFETHWSMHRIFVHKLNVKLLISLYVRVCIWDTTFLRDSWLQWIAVVCFRILNFTKSFKRCYLRIINKNV